MPTLPEIIRHFAENLRMGRENIVAASFLKPNFPACPPFYIYGAAAGFMTAEGGFLKKGGGGGKFLGLTGADRGQ